MLFSYLKEKNISCIVATHDSREALSFSDKLLIMRQGEVILYGNTAEIYNQNTDFYTATLLGDVSAFTHNGEKKMLKPHQIERVSYSDWEAMVVKNYFQGDRFLVEVSSENQPIYFFSEKKIEIGEKIYLSEKK